MKHFAVFSRSQTHQGGWSCRDQANTQPIVLRELLALKTCPSPNRWSAVAIICDDRARSAAGVAIGIAPSSGRCMIWAMWSRNDRATFTLSSPNITAASVAATSTRTCRTWLRPGAATRIVSSRWPCDWWRRTAYPTARPVGISGEITACSFHLPPFKIGLRVGGKKAEQHVSGEYLDAVLAEFSGYIAADELYDGPFCVLSIVDNRTFRRIAYEVLDHDPTHVDMEALFSHLPHGA